MSVKVGTSLKVADNSGAVLVECIRIYGGSNRKSARVGDLILVATKRIGTNSKIKRKAMHKAVVVRTKFTTTGFNGFKVNFNENAVVLLDDSSNPIGKRINGPVSSEVKARGYLKIASLTKELI